MKLWIGVVHESGDRDVAEVAAGNGKAAEVDQRNGTFDESHDFSGATRFCRSGQRLGCHMTYMTSINTDGLDPNQRM